MKCYKDKHNLCIKYSLVCDGEKCVYESIPKFPRGAYRFSRTNTEELSNLRKRMGKETTSKTRFSLTTQKAETVNHALAKTNPKHSMTCSRNGVNCDHSAIHMINNAMGQTQF